MPAPAVEIDWLCVAHRSNRETNIFSILVFACISAVIGDGKNC